LAVVVAIIRLLAGRNAEGPAPEASGGRQQVDIIDKAAFSRETRPSCAGGYFYSPTPTWALLRTYPSAEGRLPQI
jgi:hypothetical protein